MLGLSPLFISKESAPSKVKITPTAAIGVRIGRIPNSVGRVKTNAASTYTMPISSILVGVTSTAQSIRQFPFLISSGLLLLSFIKPGSSIIAANTPCKIHSVVFMIYRIDCYKGLDHSAEMH